MRKASLLPALVLGAMAPLAFAQSATTSADDASADVSLDPATEIRAMDIPADAITTGRARRAKARPAASWG